MRHLPFPNRLSIFQVRKPSLLVSPISFIVVRCCGCKPSFRYTVSRLRTSFFFFPIRSRNWRGKSNEVGEPRTGSFSYCFCRSIALYTGSMRTNQPPHVDHVVFDVTGRGSVFFGFPNSAGFAFHSPFTFDAFGRDLFHIYMTEID